MSGIMLVINIRSAKQNFMFYKQYLELCNTTTTPYILMWIRVIVLCCVLYDLLNLNLHKRNETQNQQLM